LSLDSRRAVSTRVPIVDKGSGIQLIQELVAEGLHAITAISCRRTGSCAWHGQTAVPAFDHGDRKPQWPLRRLARLDVADAGRRVASRIKYARTGVHSFQPPMGPPTTARS
jgi:hypothetical protein